MTVPCPHCGTPNSSDARFCGSCGLATSQTEPAAALPAASDMTGREIAGRYRIESKLGEGGMGTVYKAQQISLKRQIAVKLLRPDVSGNPMLLKRFNAEAELVAKLSHPNTVNIYDFGQDGDGTLYIAMELVEGRSLRSVLTHEAPLPLRRALAIAAQVASSLADAHARAIIHRDLKPDNVMLSERGRQKDVVRVLDFGIAKLRDDGRATQMAMTQAGDMLGTPQYMAPEQIRAGDIDGRTDVYALGCMLYEMVTGRLAYEGPTIMALLSKHLTEQALPPSQRRPDLGIPPMIDELIMTAMAKDPALRPPTMEAYGERIAQLLAMLPPDTNSPTAVHGHLAPQLTPAAWSAVGALPPPPTSPHGMVPGFAPPTPSPITSPYAAAPPASKRGLWIALVVLALAGAGVGIFFATKGSATSTPTTVTPTPTPTPDLQFDDEDSNSDNAQIDLPDLDIPTTAPVPATDAVKDIWADPGPDTTTEAVHEIASGVKISLPSSFVVSRPNGAFKAQSVGTLVMGAAIPTGASDASVIRQWADAEKIAVKEIEQIPFAGATRTVGALGGKLNGMDVIEIVTVLSGPGYRVLFVLGMVGVSDADAAGTTFIELSNRVVLPGAP